MKVLALVAILGITVSFGSCAGGHGPRETEAVPTEQNAEPGSAEEFVIVQNTYYTWREDVHVWVRVNEPAGWRPPQDAVVQPLKKLPKGPLPSNPTASTGPKPVGSGQAQPAIAGGSRKPAGHGPQIRPPTIPDTSHADPDHPGIVLYKPEPYKPQAVSPSSFLAPQPAKQRPQLK